MTNSSEHNASAPAACSVCGTQIPAGGTHGLCPRCLLAEAMDTAEGGAALDATIVPSSTEQDGDAMAAGLSCGDYELLEEIARGGMGVVYKARHLKLNRIAAIKMVLGGRFSSADEIRRFHVEAEAAARLDHPGIVPVYDIGEREGQAFFAMKYIDGGSLAERIEEFQRDPKAAVRLLADVATAVHHAHQRGILHRDLKPANILIDETNQPLITDLGLAKSTAGDSNLTKTGAVVGTPSYMPPEQAAGEQFVTTAVDVYSLGAILYEMLTGQPPHAKETPMATVMSVLNDTPSQPRKINAAVDTDLELICLKCIERRPDERYASAAELAADLECWLNGGSISLKPPSFSSLAARWVKQNRRVVYGVFALLIGLAFTVPLLTVAFGPISHVGDVATAYDHFPNLERPWFLELRTLPKWLPIVSLAVLPLVVWPSIGLWNAVVLRPESMRSACLMGALTSVVCGLLLTVSLGWYFVATTLSQNTEKKCSRTWNCCLDTGRLFKKRRRATSVRYVRGARESASR